MDVLYSSFANLIIQKDVAKFVSETKQRLLL